MPTSTRKKRPFYGGLPAKPRSFSILRRRGGRPCPPAGKCPFLRKSYANSQHFEGPMRRPQASFEAQPHNARLLGPMWASSPTNGHENSTNFEGGQSRPPLQMTVKNRTGHAKTAAFPISRRRGRCPHRPAGDGRFMAVFRRNRVDFLFYAVGADDPVRPPENALFHGKPMRNRNIFNGPM